MQNLLVSCLTFHTRYLITTEIRDHNYAFCPYNEKFVMHNLVFSGGNLIFTITTGKRVFLINVVHRLIFRHNCDQGDTYFHILYFLRDLVKIGFCFLNYIAELKYGTTRKIVPLLLLIFFTLGKSLYRNVTIETEIGEKQLRLSLKQKFLSG